MSKLKVYLDTSVISAYFDFRKPVRQLVTQKWFQNDLRGLSPYVSSLVLEEIGAHPDAAVRREMLELIDVHDLRLLEVNEDILEMAAIYREDVIPKETNDSIHLAVASFYRLDAVVSWNFKHMVNLATIKAIHDLNRAKGLAPVEIVTIEHLGGDKYGSL